MNTKGIKLANQAFVSNQVSKKDNSLITVTDVEEMVIAKEAETEILTNEGKDKMGDTDSLQASL